MSLFHKIYSKYYEAVTRIINSGKEYSKGRIDEFFRDEISGETDSRVENALFSTKQPSLFCFEDKKFHSYIKRHVPVICSSLEREAAKSICSIPSAGLFLPEELLEKLDCATKDVDSRWDVRDITVNFCRGKEVKRRADDAGQKAETAKKEEDSIEYREKLAVLTAAIRSRKAVIQGEDTLLYPLKLEYSYQYDEFYLWAFDPARGCHVKTSFGELTDLRGSRKSFEGYDRGYMAFMKEGQKEAELRIETNEVLAETCFRIFSYYVREACYDAGSRIYRLKIFYHPDEEEDLLGDILSLGSAVTLLSPGELQEKLCTRIRKALSGYENT